MKRTIVIFFLFISLKGYCQYYDVFKNQIGVFFLPEFSFDVRYIVDHKDYKPYGFSYSTGLYYNHTFNDQWWIQTGLFYSQVNHSYRGLYYPNFSAGQFSNVTNIVHRCGIPAYVGYYIYNEGSRFRFGVGGGLNFLFNLGATQIFNDTKQTIVLNDEQFEDFGLEFNLHLKLLYRPHRNIYLGIEPHANFNAVPLVTSGISNILRVGGTVNISYLF